MCTLVWHLIITLPTNSRLFEFFFCFYFDISDVYKHRLSCVFSFHRYEPLQRLSVSVCILLLIVTYRSFRKRDRVKEASKKKAFEDSNDTHTPFTKSLGSVGVLSSIKPIFSIKWEKKIRSKFRVVNSDQRTKLLSYLKLKFCVFFFQFLVSKS